MSKVPKTQDLTGGQAEVEITRSFTQALHDAGIFPTDDLIADSELHRVHCEDDSPGSQDGWYVIHTDAPSPYGFFGHWAEGKTHIWSERGWKELAPEERAALERHKAEAIQRQEAERAEAKARCKAAAQQIWSRSLATESHPYLTRKGIQAHGTRDYKGTLIIPLYSSSAEMVGLQLINAYGEKRFLPGTAKAGAFFKIEGNPAMMALCEGFATGASVHEATGYSVAVAFDAGNLRKVALALKETIPSSAELIICADNDAGKEPNTGLTKGREAAAAIGAKLAYPVFQDGQKGTDFNDLHALAGPAAVKNAIEAATPVAEAPEARDQRPKGKKSDQDILDACTDVTNSLHLSHAVQDKAVFVPEDNKWACCMDDGYWKFDCSHRVTETAKGVGRIWLQLAAEVEDPKARGSVKAFAKHSASSSGISAMVKLAETQEHIRRGRAEFDSNPHVIGVKNGVLNLENLCFRQAQPADYVTRRLGTAYTHNAQCPKWSDFLMESVEGDTPEEKALMVEFLQLMVAAALLGAKGLRKFFHVYGPPGSGKSLFVNTLHSLFGDYGKSMSASAISNPRFKDNDVKMPEIADLEGMRFAAVYENGEGFCFNDELLKAL